MRTLVGTAVVLIALPVLAEIRFDPPNPDSRTRVTAHVTGTGPELCGASAARTGQAIAITLVPCGFPFLDAFDVSVDLGALPADLYRVEAGPYGDASLPVSDAFSDLRVRPNVIDVNATGGQGDVHLTGPYLVVCQAGPSPSICSPPLVTIDGQALPVTWDHINTDHVIVTMPRHDPGIVLMRIRGGPGDITVPFDYFSRSAEPEPAFFERVLVPVFFFDAGAYGSQWVTQPAMFNGDAYPVVEGGGPFFSACHLDVTCPSNIAVGAGETKVATGTSVPTGVVTFVPRYAMPNVQFSLLVRDLSRDATDFGTSVPVVREREMFTRPFTLVNVPSDARYRLGLRLYAYDTIPTNFHVTITPNAGGDAIDRDVALLPAREHAFAFIGDLLAEHPSLVGKGPLRIDITPFEPATRAWGYVSITNNQTQHVTVIAPE